MGFFSPSLFHLLSVFIHTPSSISSTEHPLELFILLLEVSSFFLHDNDSFLPSLSFFPSKVFLYQRQACQKPCRTLLGFLGSHACYSCLCLLTFTSQLLQLFFSRTTLVTRDTLVSFPVLHQIYYCLCVRDELFLDFTNLVTFVCEATLLFETQFRRRLCEVFRKAILTMISFF